MKHSYTDTHFRYTDPEAYDNRVRQPIERFIAEKWDPILFRLLRTEIKDGMIVADLGCGTFIHTQHMGKAGHIYAVDINQDMLDYGRRKIHHLEDRITVLCESGTKTSIPSESCDLVWIDGLSEFLRLDDLFLEVQRILKPSGTFIILYQNRYHPENILVALFYWLTRRKGKRYRSLWNFKRMGKKYRFLFLTHKSTAFFISAPPFLQRYLIPVWRIANRLYAPLQSFFPIGNNIVCIFKKKAPRSATVS